jgi:hypothetical protein
MKDLSQNSRSQVQDMNPGPPKQKDSSANHSTMTFSNGTETGEISVIKCNGRDQFAVLTDKRCIVCPDYQ